MRVFLIFLTGMAAGAFLSYGYITQFGIYTNVPVQENLKDHETADDSPKPENKKAYTGIPGPEEKDGPGAPEKLHFKMGGKSLTVDRRFFGRDKPDTEKPEQVVLKLTYPELKPAVNRPADLKILVMEPNYKDNVKYLTESKRRSSNATEAAGEKFGMKHFVPPAGSSVKREDMFIQQKKGGEIENMVTCQLEEKKAKPVCYHYYHGDDGLLHMLVYNRGLLPDWEKIKSEARVLLEKFASTSSLKSNSAEESVTGENPAAESAGENSENELMEPQTTGGVENTEKEAREKNIPEEPSW
jgi:hypothetical protein